MTNIYRVEAQDGKAWSFGVRVDANKRIPVFCSLDLADTGAQSQMEELREWAQRVCGGTLRVAAVDA